MAIDAATNNWTQPEDDLIASFSNSAACRTWLGAADVNAAIAKMFVHIVTEPADGEEYTELEMDAIDPHILIFDGDETSIRYDSESTGIMGSDDFNANGSKIVRFVQRVDTAGALQEQVRELMNAVGDAIEEVLAMSGDESRALIRSFVCTLPPVICKTEREPSGGREIVTEFTCSYGFGNVSS